MYWGVQVPSYEPSSRYSTIGGSGKEPSHADTKNPAAHLYARVLTILSKEEGASHYEGPKP